MWDAWMVVGVGAVCFVLGFAACVALALYEAMGEPANHRGGHDD